jgi:hypothetical protein
MHQDETRLIDIIPFTGNKDQSARACADFRGLSSLRGVAGEAGDALFEWDFVSEENGSFDTDNLVVCKND